MDTAIDFAGAAQALAAALSAASVNPADAIRLLAELASFTEAGMAATSPIGASMAAMQAATGDLFRRAAVVAMARVSSQYQPSSVEDAAAVRGTVCAALDAEIVIAGDQYEDATYIALRALRAAVAADLSVRGAGLPSTTTITSNLPMPALVLSQRQYRDHARSDELVTQSDCIHPAFMPTRFKALST